MKEIVSDLVGEQAQVDVLIDQLTEEQWLAPVETCDWNFKEAVLHIAAFDWAAIELINGRGKDVTEVADANFGHDESHRVTRFSHLSGVEILRQWRGIRSRLAVSFLDCDPRQRIPWAPGLPMSARSLASARLMELWAHSVDLYDALGRDVVVTDRIKATLFLSWQARPNAYRINGLTFNDDPLYLELTLPSGEMWAKGDPDAQNVIRGSARDWALVATRRRSPEAVSLDIVGDAAEQFSHIVQTFAGDAAPASQFHPKA